MEGTVKQRLMDFISSKGLSVRKFEDACGLSNGYVKNIVKGIGTEKFSMMHRTFPDLDRDWLLYGEEDNSSSCGSHSEDSVCAVCALPAAMHRTEDAVELECPECGTMIEVPSDAVLPLVPAEITRRPDIDLEQWKGHHPHEMKEVDLRAIWGHGVFLMRVDTRAMEPEYREGSFLVLRKLPDLSYARPDGSAYVIDTLRPHTLFRYLSKERDGSYVLSAENDKRGPLYLSEADITNVYDIVGSFRIGR